MKSSKLSCELFGDGVAAIHIVCAHLDVERGRQSLVHNRIDEAARLEIGLHRGQVGIQLGPNALHVFKAALVVIFFQSNLYESCVHA